MHIYISNVICLDVRCVYVHKVVHGRRPLDIYTALVLYIHTYRCMCAYIRHICRVIRIYIFTFLADAILIFSVLFKR